MVRHREEIERSVFTFTWVQKSCWSAIVWTKQQLNYVIRQVSEIMISKYWDRMKQSSKWFAINNEKIKGRIELKDVSSWLWIGKLSDDEDNEGELYAIGFISSLYFCYNLNHFRILTAYSVYTVITYNFITYASAPKRNTSENIQTHRGRCRGFSAVLIFNIWIVTLVFVIMQKLFISSV